MGIFTARENFNAETITSQKHCRNCFKNLKGKNGLVNNYQARAGKQKSVAVCDENCWATYDHNFYLQRAFERTDDESFLNAKLHPIQI